MGKSSRLAQITNSFGHKREREWIYILIGTTLKNSHECFRDLGFGVEEWEGATSVLGEIWDEVVNPLPDC
jgi:hypothetical protein